MNETTNQITNQKPNNNKIRPHIRIKPGKLREVKEICAKKNEEGIFVRDGKSKEVFKKNVRNGQIFRLLSILFYLLLHGRGEWLSTATTSVNGHQDAGGNVALSSVEAACNK